MIAGVIVAAVAARTVAAPSIPAGDVLVLYQVLLSAAYTAMRKFRRKVADAETRLPTDWSAVLPVATISRVAAQ